MQCDTRMNADGREAQGPLGEAAQCRNGRSIAWLVLTVEGTIMCSSLTDRFVRSSDRGQQEGRLRRARRGYVRFDFGCPCLQAARSALAAGLRLWVKALLRRATSRASRDAFGEQTSPGAPEKGSAAGLQAGVTYCMSADVVTARWLDVGKTA